MRQQGKKKILPNKLQFDLQESKNKKMKKKPKRPKSKWSRMTKSVKVVKWDSMENLRVNFSREQAVESHSDESAKVQDEKTSGA